MELTNKQMKDIYSKILDAYILLDKNIHDVVHGPQQIRDAHRKLQYAMSDLEYIDKMNKIKEKENKEQEKEKCEDCGKENHVLATIFYSHLHDNILRQISEKKLCINCRNSYENKGYTFKVDN